MRVADARDTTSLRKAAQRSARDSFAGCLLRESNAPATSGLPDAGAFAEQPWNLRQAYAATRILTEDWVREVKDSDDDLRLRVFEQQYDKAIREEIPLAIDVIKRAQFFLLVLDEDAPAARELTDGGAITEEALQLVPHDARVHLVNLRTNAEVFRLKRAGQATVYGSVDGPMLDPETKAAIRRNVNNCDLASQIQAALALTK
jgi:hypothetical protein